MLLGADPELIIENEENEQVPADELFGFAGEIGTDGHSHVMEIRPAPAENPLSLVDNIEELLQKANQMIPYDLQLKAGSYCHDPIGGHIHFETRYSRKLLNLLDCYLAVPLLLLENLNDAIYRRKNTNYGLLSAYENKMWGFEYRTPPSWLVSKGITQSTLCVAFVIVKSYKARERILKEQYINESDFINCKKEQFRKFVFKNFDDLFKSKFCRDSIALHVASLKSLIHLKLQWKCDEDVLTTWKIRKPNKILINMQDQNVFQIVKESGIENTFEKLFIYGLRQDRDLDVALSFKANQDLQKYLSDQNLRFSQGVTFGRAENYNKNYECIGLGFKIRKDVNYAAEILRKICELK